MDFHMLVTVLHMAAGMRKGAEQNWRSNIVQQLQERNKSQSQSYQDLLSFHNRIFENANTLRSENLQLSIKNEQLKQESLELHRRTPLSSVDGKSNEKIQMLEQKLAQQQEELTVLLRTKGENAQALVDLNRKLNEKEKLLSIREQSLSEAADRQMGMQQRLSACEARCAELKASSDTLRDEHQALHLAFEALQEKLRKAQEENGILVERLIRIKAKDAEKMNEENENFVRKRQAKVQQELEEAAKDTRPISPDHNKDQRMLPASYSTALPQRVLLKFDAHDGEVNAARWCPVDRVVATGGADRKVKLWDIGKGVCEGKGVLVGSNAAVMSVDFDSTGSLLLAASNDFASRVWTVSDQRLRHTLTGHSGKVMAAKFLGQSARVVTGSHDRTLKIWDLRSRACVETKFAGSSCNDVVTSEAFSFISGHFDKRIRFWDARCDGTLASGSGSVNDIVLQGRVTSLDLSKDGNYLLSCVRDDTLRMFDLRMKQEVCSFSSDNFKVGCDWSRAVFSPNGQLVSAGGADGAVFVWSASSGRLVCESNNREHGSAVTAVAWHPFGFFLASVDRGKKAIIWGCE